LVGKYAEDLLQSSVEGFLKMMDCKKAAIKWNFLLERCKIKLLIKRKSALRMKAFVSVVHIEKADADECCNLMKIY
jgi:hypothetical protein